MTMTMPLRRPLFLLPVLAMGLAVAVCRPAAAEPPQAEKVFRYAFPVAETGFDPVQVSDVYSVILISNVFESPLTYDYLAQPPQLKPNTAAAMPEVSADFKTFTFRIRPGIYFSDDPAFKGQRRELVAADYVYSIKRIYDPRWKSPKYGSLAEEKILGLDALRERALKERKPFDYDSEVPGLRVLDRYTFRVQLGKTSPRFLDAFARPSETGALAREVVEAQGDRIMGHPVGTGPFLLSQWQRSSRIVFKRNPDFREEFFNGEPAEDDPEAQALLSRLKGRRLPLLDRIEVSVIEESQPRWLAFLNGEHDMIERLPDEFSTLALPNGELAPNLAKRGVRLHRQARTDIAFTYFNMQSPMVGGYAPENVALRRALALAYNTDAEVRTFRRNQARIAQSVIPPGTFGYDPAWRTEMSQYDPARARALLDMHGYIDRDGDGWRDRPDGQPLTLEYAAAPDSLARQRSELWKKYMDAIRVRMVFKIAQWPELLKSARAGKLMMWSLGSTAASPDVDGFLASGYGPQKLQANLSLFDLPAYNRLYEAQNVMGDTPERLALIQQAALLMVAYMPMKVQVHTVTNDLVDRQVVGYRRHPFRRDFWKFIDVEPVAK